MTSCVSFSCNSLLSLTLSHTQHCRCARFWQWCCCLIVCWLYHSETIACHYKMRNRQASNAQTFTEQRQNNGSIKCRKYMNVCEVRWCVKVRYFYELSKHVCCSHFVFVFNEQTETWTEFGMASERKRCDMCLYLGYILFFLFWHTSTYKEKLMVAIEQDEAKYIRKMAGHQNEDD